MRQISSNEMDCSVIDESLVALLSDLVRKTTLCIMAPDCRPDLVGAAGSSNWQCQQRLGRQAMLYNQFLTKTRLEDGTLRNWKLRQE